MVAIGYKGSQICNVLSRMAYGNWKDAAYL